MVLFPLHQPRSPATRIVVRPWSPKSWPTVWSQHEFRGTTVRLKQLVGPWEILSGFPPLLSYLAGNLGGGGDRVYGPPLTTFCIGTMPVAHGGHFYRKEGGAAIAHMVLLDLVMTRDRLGPVGLRSFLTGLSWADERLSPARYRRPLYEWAWSLREQRDMWSWPRAKSWPHPLEWSRTGLRVDPGGGLPSALREVSGFHLDCVGKEIRTGGGPREVHLFYRPFRGHAPLVVRLYRGIDVPRVRSGQIYRACRSRICGHPATILRAPSAGSSRVDADLGGRHMVVFAPAPTTSRRSDYGLRIAAQFVRGFTRLV